MQSRGHHSQIAPSPVSLAQSRTMRNDQRPKPDFPCMDLRVLWCIYRPSVEASNPTIALAVSRLLECDFQKIPAVMILPPHNQPRYGEQSTDKMDRRTGGLRSVKPENRRPNALAWKQPTKTNLRKSKPNKPSINPLNPRPIGCIFGSWRILWSMTTYS